MPGILLNGQKVAVDAGQTVLTVARQLGVFIPSLCYHPGLGPYAACRLCLVELKAGMRKGLMASCALPALDGLVVETDSLMVREGRKLVMELLLARAPESREIQTLAKNLGVEATDLPHQDELCILCGRCVRACKALGVNAIAFVGRGTKRRVTVPFDKPSGQCIACQACVSVCPTGAIKAKITPQEVEMVTWHTHQAMRRCTDCDQTFVTERQQAHVDKIIEAGHQPHGTLCPQCRRRMAANQLASIPETHYGHGHTSGFGHGLGAK